MTSSNFLFKRETSNAANTNKFLNFSFSVRHIETKIGVGGVSFERVGSHDCRGLS